MNDESKDIVKFGEGFNTMNEAMKFAEIVSKTDFSPPTMKGKPYDILMAIQFGAEVGLKPMQSLQNISVINSRPSIWGDAALALIKTHKDYEYCEEYMENEDTAVCKIKRKGEPEHTIIFKKSDAIAAGLINERLSPLSPWKKYPKRMLQMRARGFALRDAFPDALKGLVVTEEAQDYDFQDTKKRKKRKKIEDEAIIEDGVIVEVENTNDEQENSNINNEKKEHLLKKFKILISKGIIKNEDVVNFLKKENIGEIEEIPIDILEKIVRKYDHIEENQND